MSEKVTDEEEENELDAPERVAIESKLPLTAIDIESQKDMKSGRYHKLRSLHKWFAARPTPAARLSVLASVYPGHIDPDELLKLMQIGPKAMDSGISEHVEKRFSESKSSGTLDDHYGYPNPNTQSPTKAQIEELHETLREGWGGELPTVLDPTAGRGIIPFEAMRYGLSTKVNELNPVPSLILRAALEYVPEVGSLDPEIYEWRDKIHETAKEKIEPYYPTEEPERQILNSACTYLIQCSSCGGDVPLVGKWWLDKTSDGGDAIKPKYRDGEVEYQHVKIPEDVTLDEYDPTDGPVQRRDAECPHCGVVTEEPEIKTKIQNDEFEYSIYGVNYEKPNGEWGFRAGSDVDRRGMQKAAERVDSDFDLLTFLSEPVDISSRTHDPRNYGMDEWRDIFTPRQLVSHYEYAQAFKKHSKDIKEQYSQQKADAILTILTFAASRALIYSTRLSPWLDSRGYVQEVFSDNNYALKRMFGDNNLCADRRGYIKSSNHVIDSYEELVNYSPSGRAEIVSQDAATLTDQWDDESVDVAVVDPPYYSSIMYGELSDIFYVVEKEYLQETHPSLFHSKLTNKDDEAVANPSRFEDIADGNDSKNDLADEFYEQKMQDIFSEVHQLLNPGGIMTVMFTHRDMDAWDTLVTALINAGFTITATHPIKTEMSDRIGMQGHASADSSILLVGRKRENTGGSGTALWEDVKSDIQTVARKEAEEILASGYTISKTDTAIAAYGPTLQRYAEEYPVVNKKGENIRPWEALGEARKAVTGVIAEQFLETEGIEQLDPLTRWYVLAWLIYDNDTFPYDEGRQLGVAAGVDIDDVKRTTKIWSKSSGDIQLKDHESRVQDIVMLRSDSADNPSSRKYPVNPTDQRYTYTIDAIHAALHVYEREGAKAAWEWLTERGLKSDDTFEIAITALLEVLPSDMGMHNTLVNLVSGETGEYLDINLDHIDMSGVDRQSELGDHIE